MSETPAPLSGWDEAEARLTQYLARDQALQPPSVNIPPEPQEG
jgi:hypothetical protein